MAIILEKQYWYYLTHSKRDDVVQAFSKGNNLKVNATEWPELELVIYASVIQHVSHNFKMTPPVFFVLQKKKKISPILTLSLSIYIYIYSPFSFNFF